MNDNQADINLKRLYESPEIVPLGREARGPVPCQPGGAPDFCVDGSGNWNCTNGANTDNCGNGDVGGA